MNQQLIDPKVLSILVCPATHQSLSLASDALVAKVQEEIATGNMKTVSGEKYTGTLEGILIREDGKVGYPVQGKIPVLLIEAGLRLEAE